MANESLDASARDLSALDGMAQLDSARPFESDFHTVTVDTGTLDQFVPVDGGVDAPDTGDLPRVNCDLISAANPAWEVCSAMANQCSGVFTDGAGCAAFCAAAGLTCLARYGGEPGCIREPQNELDCEANNDHMSDWCTCGRPSGMPPRGPDDPGMMDPECPVDPNDRPTILEMNYREARFTQRHNWVLDCYDYAYTARAQEHQACDGQFHPDGSRRGTAIFVFVDVPQGRYEVLIGARHTENRNGAGAVFLVNERSRTIDQRVHAPDRVWDHHGVYCLSGQVQVVLDSSVNGGSDSVSAIRLEPMN